MSWLERAVKNCDEKLVVRRGPGDWIKIKSHAVRELKALRKLAKLVAEEHRGLPIGYGDCEVCEALDVVLKCKESKS